MSFNDAGAPNGLSEIKFIGTIMTYAMQFLSRLHIGDA